MTITKMRIFCGGLPPRTERGNPALRPPAGRHDQRRQIGSLRKKKSPAPDESVEIGTETPVAGIGRRGRGAVRDLR
jgi:hypothetical protein